MAALSFSFESLKEPRGFIRIIELILAIFAFSTTVAPYTSTTFTVKECPESPVTYSYGYPYDLEQRCFSTPICTENKTGQFCLLAGAKASAQFFVFVGVMTFLYCLASLVLYIFFDDVYRNSERVTIGDFLGSVVLTLLWIISSSAWATGVSDIKMYTDPASGGIYGTDYLPECYLADYCYTNNDGNFAELNVSIIFGFLNFAVWGGNLWFLWKETSWFKGQTRSEYSEAPQAGSAPEGYQR